jgi:hypothetical protein
MWWRLVSIAVLGGSLAACAPSGSQQRAAEAPQPITSPAVFTHRVSTTQVVLYWNCARPESGQLRLEGLAYSPYFSDVRALEFDLVGVDSKDRVVSEVRGEPRDVELGLNRTSPFQLTLRTTGNEDRFDLYYGYRSQGGIRSRLAGPPVVDSTLWAQNQNRFMARDVCSETQPRYPRPFG